MLGPIKAHFGQIYYFLLRSLLSSNALMCPNTCYSVCSMYKRKLTCLLMLSRLHGKQNLWWFTDGHCTKCVSSSRSWQSVHLSVGFGAGAAPLGAVFPGFVGTGFPKKKNIRLGFRIPQRKTRTTYRQLEVAVVVHWRLDSVQHC